MLSLVGKSQETKSKYTDFDYGIYLWYYDKWDSAYFVFNRYINDNPADILNKGRAYKFMGEMQWYFGDLYGAEENLSNAIHTLDSSNQKHYEELGYIYNVLGNINLDLKFYQDAIKFYNKAISYAKGTNFMYEVMNGKATTLQKSGNYNDAIAIYDSILSISLTDQSLIARIIDNRANTRWLQNPAYSPLPELWTALKIRVDSQYNPGLIASYEHLADYYAKIKPDSALWYADTMLSKAKEIRNSGDILRAIDKLVFFNSSPFLKEYWHKEYKILNDSIQLVKDTTRKRFALIRFDFQRIKDVNMVLQKNNATQRFFIYGIVLFSIVAIISLIVWYRKRRKRIRQEAEKAIQESKLKTSQKVHDVVANGLYVIMNELEHGDSVEREPLITKIEGLYEKSRNISYEDASSGNTAEYDKQISQLLTSFASEQTKVVIVGNEPAFWKKVSSAQKQELELILKELMVNMKKHSQAKNVAIVFKQENNKGFINYTDDGTGFTPDHQFGNGLNNTVNRINSFNGEVNFGKSGNGGAAVAISFPLQSSKT